VTAPLAPAQQQLWIDELLRPGTARNCLALTVSVDAAMEVARLRAALDTTAARHPMLRARVHVDDDGEPRLAFVPDPPQLQVHRSSSRLPDALAAAAATPFHDVSGPLIRFDFWQQRDDLAVLLVTAHHLVLDAVSGELLVDALAEAYVDPAGRAWRSAPPTGAYHHYAAARAAQLAATTTSADRFWDRHLHGLPPQPAWPALEPAPPAAGPVRRVVDSAPLRAAAAAQHASVTALVLAAAAAAIAGLRVQAGPDLLIGLAISDRPPGYERTIGNFVDVLPLRISLPPGRASGRDLLPATRDLLLDLLDLEPVPALRILRRSPQRIRIEQSLSVRRSWARTLTAGEQGWTARELPIAQSPYPCSVDVCEEPNGTHTVAVHHDPARVRTATAARVLRRLVGELHSLTDPRPARPGAS
jgi:hypothetical protein